MHFLYQGLITVILGVLLVSCSTETTYAPVVDVNAIEPIPQSGQHKVTPGETIYEIAWRYGLDYRSVATKNQMQAPYKVDTGQSIELRQQKPAPAVAVPQSVVIAHQNKEPHYKVSKWLKPATGKIVRFYSANNKGIDIAGKLNEPVYAAGPGKVVYSGDGLRGYGNLIIIKHNNLYLSAYAYNRVNLVKEGEWVKQGQIIAKMGTKSTGIATLHFEIRRAGKPVNPVNMLS